jgi:hypothetical protein
MGSRRDKITWQTLCGLAMHILTPVVVGIRLAQLLPRSQTPARSD